MQKDLDEDVLDTVLSRDAAAIARREEKNRLVQELCFLADQGAALDKAVEERRNRLRLLMSEDGDRAITTPTGSASFSCHTSYSIHDKAAFAAMFTKDALIEIAKPTKAFVEAAQQLRVDVGKAISTGVDQRFKVERAKSAEAVEMQRRIIESSRQELERRIQGLTARMRGE